MSYGSCRADGPAREDTERPDGMPVFTIKAQDDLALRVVSAYRELCVSEGLSEQAYQVAKAIGEITEWRIAHPERCKLPDHTHVPVFRNSGTVDEYLAAGGKIETITDNLEDALDPAVPYVVHRPLAAHGSPGSTAQSLPASPHPHS